MEKFITFGTKNINSSIFRDIIPFNTKPYGGLWLTKYTDINANEWLMFLEEHPSIFFQKFNGEASIIELNDNYTKVMKKKINDKVIGQDEAVEELINLSKRINVNFDSSCIKFSTKLLSFTSFASLLKISNFNKTSLLFVFLIFYNFGRI